jgi:hypothetical protein
MVANYPLRGNVIGILTIRDSNTPEELKSLLSVRIRRTPVELPHSTELELLRGLPTSREVLQPSEPCLFVYSTKNGPGSTIGS